MLVLEALGAGAAAALATALLTEMVRRRALQLGIQDVPNERSSHSRATPRGGGLAIAVVVLAGCMALAVLTRAAWPWIAALALGSCVNAAVGWADDRFSLSVGFRLAMQFLVAGAALLLVGPLLRLEVLPGVLLPMPVAVPFVALYLTWMTNLFNFMDGIDGIAGVEAATVGLTVAAGAAAAGHPGVAVMSSTLAGAGGGFLTHNWQPARIFMGDVGSLLVGYALGMLSLWAASDDAFGLPAFLIAMSVFVVDATVTLLLRALRGEDVTKAHRTHAYQHLARRVSSHRFVSLGVLAVNLGVLLPAALWADLHPQVAWVVLAVAWGVLAAVCGGLGAGAEDGSAAGL